jgi:hypothetical protein
VATLSKQFKEIEDSIKPMESEIIIALEAGTKLEPGSPIALVSIEQRRCPKWKEEFIRTNSKGRPKKS